MVAFVGLKKTFKIGNDFQTVSVLDKQRECSSTLVTLEGLRRANKKCSCDLLDFRLFFLFWTDETQMYLNEDIPHGFKLCHRLPYKEH